ncbi:MAG: S-adenosylhomocysteine deaminase [Fimbriimonadales bacterium]|nr:MAG: S-adenosylhomocysteine deaminase [Fimbriimonadales bacterium]
MEHRTLILRANWVLPMSHDPLPDGEVVVENGQIVAVRPRSDLSGAEVIEFGDAILMPGLINGHCHLEYTALRGLDDRTPFFEWIRALVALKAKCPPEIWLPSALLGAAELIASGVTFVSDNTDSGVSAEVLARAGLRGRVYQEVFGIESPPDDAAVLRELGAKLDALRTTLQHYEATERISLGIAPHAIYTVRDSLMRAVRQYAREGGLPLSIHAAESSEEVALARSGSGSFAEMFVERKINYLPPRVPPIEYLHNAGILAPDVQVVHATRAEPREQEMMARSGVSVAHCPRSNARLLTGVAPVYAMRRLGIPIVLGTDSAVSGGGLDIWEEVRFAALAQRAASYAAHPIWRDWIGMLTLDGAKAFGVDSQIGSLEVGKRADVIAVRTTRLAFSNMPDPYAALVLVARSEDVALTMCDGRILYQDGQFTRLDVASLRASASAVQYACV